jgi:hypothetical protein
MAAPRDPGRGFASMLLRPLTDLKVLALDPLPGILGRCTAQLLGMRREDFVHILIDAPIVGEADHHRRP